MAESTIPSTSGEHCHFFSLPRELRDEIYEYAYTPHKNTEYWYRVTESDINATREDFMTVTKDGLSMPPTLCQAVAVSKQYLAEALPFWIQQTNFHFSSPRDVDYLTFRYRLIEENLTSVFIRYDSLAARHETDVPVAEIVNACPRLTRFEARLHGRQWCDGNRFIWAFTEPFMNVVDQLVEMRELQWFRLSRSDFLMSEFRAFEEQLEAVEALIRAYVSESATEDE
ncbi:hypothetical protein LTR37_015522 [Vermiconidia calcicola]|uniref:Uncharacterized protein n=1 Tax=Vermiconidia calcicola TaxID=1690605 RepID=A0ACC3MR99_9PEZI|nr:hypothetical protein LTR37_015522 [Vermiconidia calcicola]